MTQLSSSPAEPAEPAPGPGSPTIRYAVIASSGEWRVLSGRAQIGHFDSRAEALAVAVGLAKQAAAAGCAIELLAQPNPDDFRLTPIYQFAPER